jgi:glutaredoxin 3
VPKIRVYKTNSCGYCVAAMSFLDQKGLAYEAIDCSSDPDTRRWLVETTGRTTVPQIFVGDRAIGGYTDLRALDASGEFQKLLAA